MIEIEVAAGARVRMAGTVEQAVLSSTIEALLRGFGRPSAEGRS
jgi:hypothetical protein